jgi:chaperonin GroEL
MDKVGKDGTITVEEAKSIETRSTLSKACSSTRVSLALFRHQRRDDGSRLEDAYILIYEKKISSLKDLLPLLEKVPKSASRC